MAAREQCFAIIEEDENFDESRTSSICSSISEVEPPRKLRLRTILQSSSYVANSDSLESLEVRLPQKNESKDPGTSWYAAVFLVVNAALGAGLLNFPQAFDQAGGIFVAVIVQAVLLTFIIASLMILAHCSDNNKCSTYQDMVYNTCGKRCQQLCAIAIVLYCYGTCITFVIIIGDQFDRALASWYGQSFCHYWYMSRNFTMIVSSVLLILPMCFSKRIDFLKYASSFGVLAILYVVFLITYKFYEGKHEGGPVKTRPSQWSDVFLVVPVICFGYQCHVSCIPVYSCLKDRRVKTFLRTVIVAVIICVITYTGAATYGYLTFGTLVASDIMESYDAKDPLVFVGIIALAIKTYTTYPILLFCGRVAIDDLYLQLRHMPKEIASKNELCRRIVIALIWFCSSLTLAVVIPNIGVVIQILGSLAAIFIFVFPGLCLLRITLMNDEKLSLARNKMLILASGIFLVVGAFIFGLVFTQAIMQDVSQDQKMGDLVLCV